MKKIILFTIALAYNIFAFGQMGKFYGLRYDVNNHIIFCSIDTSGVNDIATLTNVTGIPNAECGMDNIHGKFFFIGTENKTDNYLYFIDVKTGNILKKTSLPSSLLQGIKCDSKSNKIFGVQTPSNNKVNLVLFDTQMPVFPWLILYTARLT